MSHLADMDLDLFLTALALDDDIGLAPGGDMEIHAVGMHMHELGTRGRVSVLRSNGTEGCLLDIPDWDFHWQGGYELEMPFTVGPNDPCSSSAGGTTRPPTSILCNTRYRINEAATFVKRHQRHKEFSFY